MQRHPTFLGFLITQQLSRAAYASPVSSNTVRTAARRRIEEIADAATDAMSMRVKILAALRRVVEFDDYVWVLTDPRTAVGASPLADVPCLPRLPALIKLKYLTQLNRWTELTRTAPHTQSIHDRTNGALLSSLIWREMLGELGVADVCSTVFVDQHGCWAFLDLWRRTSPIAFDTSDRAFVESILPTVTSGLRARQAATFIASGQRPHPQPPGPVVLLLDDDLIVRGQTDESRLWLEILIPPGPGDPAIPAIVYNAAAQLLAVESGVDDSSPSARTHLNDGFWITAHATRFGSTASDGERWIAVTLEPTSPDDRLDLFARAFALSHRETELLTLLARGLDTRALAGRMVLSESTVQDHLKAIFSKTGCHSRRAVLTFALGASAPPGV